MSENFLVWIHRIPLAIGLAAVAIYSIGKIGILMAMICTVCIILIVILWIALYVQGVLSKG